MPEQTTQRGLIGEPDLRLVAEWRARLRAAQPGAPVREAFVDPILATAFALLGVETGRGLRLLDVGCGAGGTAGALARTGFEVVGIDVNAGALSRVAAREEVALVRADAASLPFDDATFDVILSVSVMQYVDWRTAFSECLRVLRPGGRAFFVENLRGNPLARLYRGVRGVAGGRWLPDQVPREHPAWADMLSLELPGAEIRGAAFHLTTPLVLWRTALRYARSGVPLELGSARGFRLLEQTDRLLTRRFPSLRAACWLGLVCLRKLPASTDPGHS